MAIDNLFDRRPEFERRRLARGGEVADIRIVDSEAVSLTLPCLRAYWDQHEHVAVAYSGGKDSTATLTLIIHLIDAGELPQPERLYVLYADTRQELPPIQAAAEMIMAKLAEWNWIEVIVVRAPIEKRFMPYILAVVFRRPQQHASLVHAPDQGRPDGGGNG